MLECSPTLSQQAIIPTNSIPSFSNQLKGNDAFYLKTGYLEETRKAMKRESPLPVCYEWNTESKITRIAKQILSILIFPIGMYQLLHSFAGKVGVLPASSPVLMGCPENYANRLRHYIDLNQEWKYKRLTIKVDGYKVDAMIVGKESTLGNGRWVLGVNGNGEFYENKLLEGHQFTKILTNLQGNGLVFNYPGVGVSTGLPSRSAMVKAYLAMISFLEDKQGIGASEIIGYGHSIGGGTQGEALKSWSLKNHIKYVFVYSRTFSSLSLTASLLINKVIGFVLKLLGWNLNPLTLNEAKGKEIILQTAHVKESQEMIDPLKIRDDGVIPIKASLAWKLLQTGEQVKNRAIYGIRETHNEPLEKLSFLTDLIKN